MACQQHVTRSQEDTHRTRTGHTQASCFLHRSCALSYGRPHLLALILVSFWLIFQSSSVGMSPVTAAM